MNKESKDDRFVEIVPTQNSISICGPVDLHIKAVNVEIEAEREMKLKSGSVMTINGSLVKIN